MARQSALRLDDRTFVIEPYVKKAMKLPDAYISQYGALFSADCMAVLPCIEDAVIDTVFADPPFNLGKEYGKNCDDLKPDEEYFEVV